MNLSRDERKPVALVVLSLIPAIVLFALFQSSAQLANGALSVGGPFGAFVITLILLNQAWPKPSPLEEQAKRADKGLVTDDLVKVLNLRRAPPTASPQIAHHNEMYRVRRTMRDAKLTLHYATSGRMRFVSSPNPGAKENWRELPGEKHEGASGETFTSVYETDIDLEPPEGTQVDPDQSFPVVTHLLYEDAFDGADGDAIETHIDYPTGRLAMIVLMPDGYRCIGARGLTKDTSRPGEPKEIRPAPVVLEDGAIVYWGVPDPNLRAAYQLVWRWTPISQAEAIGSE